MRDTVMNEKYFREYILEETGRIKNFQNKLVLCQDLAQNKMRSSAS